MSYLVRVLVICHMLLLATEVNGVEWIEVTPQVASEYGYDGFSLRMDYRVKLPNEERIQVLEFSKDPGDPPVAYRETAVSLVNVKNGRIQSCLLFRPSSVGSTPAWGGYSVSGDGSFSIKWKYSGSGGIRRVDTVMVSDGTLSLSTSYLSSTHSDGAMVWNSTPKEILRDIVLK